MQAASIPQLKQQSEKIITLLKEYENHANWKQTSENGNFKVFSMEVGDGVASKGVTVVNFSIEEVSEFLTRPGTLMKLNPDCVKDEDLHNEDGLRIIYQQYKAPWPVAWRDFVAVTKRAEEGGKYYRGTKSCDQLYPYPEQNKIVRAHIVIGGWILEKIDENTTKVTYIANSDIKGSIPGMVKNSIAKNQGQVVSKIEPLMKQEKQKK